MQDKDKIWRPVTYISHSMRNNECHYAQRKKDSFAITYSSTVYLHDLSAFVFTWIESHTTYILCND